MNEKSFNRLTRATTLFLIVFGLLVLLGAFLGDAYLFVLAMIGFLFVLSFGLLKTKIRFNAKLPKL